MLAASVMKGFRYRMDWIARISKMSLLCKIEIIVRNQLGKYLQELQVPIFCLLKKIDFCNNVRASPIMLLPIMIQSLLTKEAHHFFSYMRCFVWFGTIYTVIKQTHVKHSWRSVIFNKRLKPVTLLKITLPHGCFSLFKNCAKGTNTHKLSHMHPKHIKKILHCKKIWTSWPLLMLYELCGTPYICVQPTQI